jgi:hypothetical protein
MVRPERELLSGVVELDQSLLGGRSHGKAGGATEKAPITIAVERLPSGRLGCPRLDLAEVPNGVDQVEFACDVSAPAPRSTPTAPGCLPGLATTASLIAHTPGYLASDLDAVMPGPHLVSSLLKRWTAGTLHHRISRQHLPYYSQVLAIHAALLRTGHVLFFAGSGNNTVREADPSYGDVNQHMWTSVVWDPDAPPGANFSHPATLQRADGRPFDFFCCGHAPLSDGRILAGGGNLAYNHGNNLGQRDAASFDPAAGQWSTRPPTAHGRRLSRRRDRRTRLSVAPAGANATVVIDAPASWLPWLRL